MFFRGFFRYEEREGRRRRESKGGCVVVHSAAPVINRHILFYEKYTSLLIVRVNVSVNPHDRMHIKYAIVECIHNSIPQAACAADIILWYIFYHPYTANVLPYSNAHRTNGGCIILKVPVVMYLAKDCIWLMLIHCSAKSFLRIFSLSYANSAWEFVWFLKFKFQLEYIRSSISFSVHFSCDSVQFHCWIRLSECSRIRNIRSDTRFHFSDIRLFPFSSNNVQCTLDSMEIQFVSQFDCKDGCTYNMRSIKHHNCTAKDIILHCAHLMAVTFDWIELNWNMTARNMWSIIKVFCISV